MRHQKLDVANLLSDMRVEALEAKCTAAADKDMGSTGGPLPLSQNQRDQLTQLDQTIAASSNPTETLAKIAHNNGMSTDELGDLLMRNRRDMQMANGTGNKMKAGITNTLPRQILRLFSTFLLFLSKYAAANPRPFSLFLITLLLLSYVSITAPKNGILLSNRYINPFSSGHSTFLSPPTPYLKNNLQSQTSIPCRVVTTPKHYLTLKLVL